MRFLYLPEPTTLLRSSNAPSLRQARGFTLIELMIVVGIIGILVSIAAPNFARYQSKARQAEAKLALGAIYALEKSFYSEYDAYVPSFTAIGYAPEGNRRFYRVGWKGTGSDYTGTITGYTGPVTTTAYNGLNTPFAACSFTLLGASFPWPNDAPFDTNDPQAFEVGAIGTLRSGGNCDGWTINHLKSLRNVQVGL